MLFVLETKPMPGSRRLRDTEREKEGERGKEQGEQGIREMGKLKRGGGRVQQVRRRGTRAEGRRERADSWESKRELSRDSQLKDRDCEPDTDAARGRGEHRAARQPARCASLGVTLLPIHAGPFGRM